MIKLDATRPAVLEQRLDYRFDDPDLLKTALTHRSYAFEQNVEDNERLEFLGDAVLELTVSTLLHESRPKDREGQLTLTRAALVNESGLTEVARGINLGDHLLLGRGEAQSGGRSKPSILSNAMEAVLGAIFLDGGFEAALEVVRKLFESGLEQADKHDGLMQDGKTMLQEHCQKETKQAPEYVLIDSSGPDHERVFTVQAVLQGRILGTGSGSSKKEAEKSAARAALTELGLVE